MGPVTRDKFVRSAQPRALAYRVYCVTEQGRAFSFAGVFRSDWEAIDQAIDLGAAVARPHRVQPASPRC